MRMNLMGLTACATLACISIGFNIGDDEPGSGGDPTPDTPVDPLEPAEPTQGEPVNPSEDTDDDGESADEDDDDSAGDGSE
jgi:hypothetical protein